jgi:hypothetical protein
MVCGRGTGRSGIGITGGFEPPSSIAAPPSTAPAAGAAVVAAPALVVALDALPVAGASCLLSQAAEASKIEPTMTPSQRMRVA